MYRMTVEIRGKVEHVMDYDDDDVERAVRDADEWPEPGFPTTIIIWTREDNGSLHGSVMRRNGEWSSSEATARDRIRNACVLGTLKVGE